MTRPVESVAVIALVVTVAVLGLLAAPSVAAAGHRVCRTNPVTRTVTCYVVNDPQPPEKASHDRSGVTEGGCALNGHPISCRGVDGSWWSNSEVCYVILVDPQPPRSSDLWRGHTTGAVYMCLGGQGGYFWSVNTPGGAAAVTPARLARAALAKVRAPRPRPGRYPSGRLADGRPFTVVRAYTWYWTDPAGFHPLTARAAAGPVWAKVMVTPVALTFTPGDGHAAVSCAGPGTVWTAHDGVWAASPSGCDYRYPHSSIHDPGQTVTATYGIRWQASWVGSGGAAGDLPGFSTNATATFAVAEAEAVVTQ